MESKYIVATIHPFVLGQEIYVYINDECVQVLECTLEDMGEKIYMLANKYDINRVDFHGGQLYALRFKDQFAANKYGNKHIEVYIH